MSLLSKITTGRKGRPQKVVISGPEGFGKSTLASRFPSPLFLDVEDSTSQLDVARLSRSDIPDLAAFDAALDEVIKSKPCKTLVTDTADWLEQMAVEEIIAKAKSDKITGIEDFGYGKGYTILRERITILLSKFDRVIANGMHVVLLAHSKVVKFEPPDGAGPYDRYELKLSKQVAPLIKEWADMFLFGNWRTQVAERDKNETGAKFKGVGGRERLMHCNRTAAWDAKNRHSMADVEKWGVEVIKKAFLSVGAPWDEAAPATSAPAKAQNLETGEVVTLDPSAIDTSAQDAIDRAADDLDMTPVPDPALKAVCEPHAAAITDYLLRNGKITAGQDWRYMPADFAARVLKNPAKFINVATNGKAVAA